MYKTTLKAAAFASAIGLGFAAVPAAAAPVISCSTTSCTFGNSDPTVGTGTFFDTYTFVLPYARTFVGQIFSNAVNFPVDNVNFLSNGVRLDNIKFTNTSVGNPEIRDITTVLAAGTHTITVRGSSGPDGFYTGTASLGGVPEPMTWAMMFLGFGLVGAGLRRRSKQIARVAYA
ncbi:MAG: FxDxF family PEP-CTERM protein [Sphingopyxis sp.]|uniref:FxDxF family PEP-CTERM protein n=1 Tax=Sphingopyxis sp. TaxID=1908224 RepID=UPI002AB9E6CB|nr:FxDxF family PEP-CTERM protein [Sphingopyxis sp.]MDZ3833680.1 FxDxF family PEP-CTERM protein [Sphingopyxis sp.]